MESFEADYDDAGSVLLNSSNEDFQEMEHCSEVERLEGPTVPPNDENNYRIIRLSNGFVAFLISAPDNSSEAEELCVNCTEKPSVESNRAFCSLNINVGGFNNPSDIPCLNECTAELISRGSFKYPENDNLHALAESFNGRYNLFTKCEVTVFEVKEILHDELHKVMDRMAQLFTEPLMSKDILHDVRKVVEANVAKQRHTESVKTRLLINMAVPEHPLSKMSDRCLNAFRNITDARLYTEILKFREQYYSAHRMTFIFKSRLPLHTMTEYVYDYFNDLPTNDLPPEDFRRFHDVDPFDPHKFRRIYKIKSPKEDFNLSLNWVMPSLIRNYRSKPHAYIASLIERKGEGSLLHFLQRNEWCTNICASMKSCASGYTQNSMYSLFEVNMSLTEQGIGNFKRVLDAFFSYVNLLRYEGPQIRYFRELQNIQEMKFRLGNEDMKCAHKDPLLYYKPADLLTAEHLYFEYDEEAIEECLDVWTPDRMNVVIFEVVPKPEEVTHEEWYCSYGEGTEISTAWIEDWRTIGPLPDFHYPPPNTFVVDDFTVRTVSNDLVPFPINIHSDESFEVWWKPNSQTTLHETYINCHWISPLPFASASNMAMLDIYLHILNKLLEENSTLAVDAGYSYFLCKNYKGLWIQISGLSPKLPLFMYSVTRFLVESPSRITEEMFNIEKQRYPSNRIFDMTDTLCGMITLSLRRKIHWSKIGKQIALRDVEFDQFQRFIGKYTERLRTCFLMHGNMTKDEAIQVARNSVAIMNSQPLLHGTVPQRIEVVFPPGIRCCRVKSLGSSTTWSYVENIYQFHERSFKLAAMIDFLRLIVEPLTLSNDGNEFCVVDSYFNTNGYTIHGDDPNPPNEHTLYNIDDRIERFRESLHRRFDNESEEAIAAMKEELIEEKIQECEDDDLNDEVRRHWQQIISGDYVFDRSERQIDVIRNMRTAEFRAWLLKLTLPATDRRISKISVQIDAFNRAIFNDDDPNPEMRDYSLQFLPAVPRIFDGRVSDYCIMNIEAFKRDLEVLRNGESMA